jgi:hypothetical protein
LVFKKNANFFAENWEKSQKTVIITSTPGLSRIYLHTYTSGLYPFFGKIGLRLLLNKAEKVRSVGLAYNSVL